MYWSVFSLYFFHHLHLKTSRCRLCCLKLTHRYLPDFEEYAAFTFQQNVEDFRFHSPSLCLRPLTVAHEGDYLLRFLLVSFDTDRETNKHFFDVILASYLLLTLSVKGVIQISDFPHATVNAPGLPSYITLLLSGQSTQQQGRVFPAMTSQVFQQSCHFDIMA